MKYSLLDPFRGLAALWVFCFHYYTCGGFHGAPPGLRALFGAGYLGVPMFFVISGYCITASARATIRNEGTTAGFLFRRGRRVYPAYWFSLLVVVALPFAMELLSSLKSGGYVPPSAANPNYGFLNYGITDWLRATSLAQVFASVPEGTGLENKFTATNAVYWTLAIEVQFYLAVTLALTLRRFFYPVLLAITLVSIPFLFVPARVLSGIFLPYWAMFGVGVLLYWFFEKGLAPSHLLGPKAPMLSAILAAGFVLAFFIYLVQELPIGYLSFAVFFGLFLFIAEGLDVPFGKKVLASRRTAIRVLVGLAMALGAMSYSLYLLHGRVQFLSMQLARQILEAHGPVYDGAVITVTCAMCYLFYLVCERPFVATGPGGRRGLNPAAPGWRFSPFRGAGPVGKGCPPPGWSAGW